MAKSQASILLSKAQIDTLVDEIKMSKAPAATIEETNIEGVVAIMTKRRTILVNHNGAYLAQHGADLRTTESA